MAGASDRHAMHLKGLRTVIYQVDDLAAAKRWYAGVLGVAPYFDEPFYVGFNVAGFELGLQDEQPSRVPVGNQVAYWGVDDAERALAHLLAAGAAPVQAVQDVGGGIRVASVRDPFGNVFGIIENPQFRAE